MSGLEDELAQTQHHLAVNIRQRAKKSGLYLKELAREAEITEVQLHNILAGRSAVTLRVLVKLAVALRTSASKLLAAPRQQ